MNYIELINNFWLQDESWQFSSNETRLYFYLLKTANRLGWHPQWKRSDERVSIETAISVNTMKQARKKLVKAGLIAYTPGRSGKNQQTVYRILEPRMLFQLTESLTDNLTDTLTDNLTENLTPSSLYIGTRIKQKQKKKHCPPTLEEVKDFFSEKLPGWEEQAELFYHHFDALGWLTATGGQIRSWKGRANYWIKEEQIRTSKTNHHEDKRKPQPNTGGTHSAATQPAGTGNLDQQIDAILGRT